MADGFHRWRAARDAGIIEIAADVRQGDKRAAILFSVGANSISQVNRSNADKRNAVKMLLQHPKWGQLSPSQIADACAVGETFVRNVRSEQFPAVRNSTGKDGKSYPAKKAKATPKTPVVSVPMDLSGARDSFSLPNKSNDESQTLSPVEEPTATNPKVNFKR